jgi:uncharacterized RDD family membrane protein YckC
MFCQVCGTRVEESAVACPNCGAETRQPPSFGSPAPVAVADPKSWVQAGPSCIEHPGMPLLGNCPRCGKQVCVRCAPDAVSDNFTCGDCYGLSKAHGLAPQGSVCAVHPDKRAVFVCSRCGAFACASCKPAYDTTGKCLKCAGTVGALASRGDRFVAAFVDNLVILVPLFISVGVMVAFSNKNGKDSDAYALLAVAVMGMTFLGTCGIQLWSQLRSGQSIGKRLTGIKVVRRDGSPIELWRLILMRNVVIAVLGQACWGIFSLVDVLLIFKDDRRCLHDYMADSIVVDVPPAGTEDRGPRTG